GRVDLLCLDNSRFVQSTGQSGHVLSKHYSDMADLWVKGEYVTIPTDPAQYRASQSGTWTLTPSQ
ncbi:MAG: penicillin acylase family protein, partial [Pseudomonadota bacterium]